MGPKTVYCPRFKHFKDTLVCRLNCPSARRCRIFQEYEAVHGRELEERIEEYLAQRKGRFDRQYYLEVKAIMKEEVFMVIDSEGKTEIMKREEILLQAEKGGRFRQIYRISHEMELRYQLVPKQDKEKAVKRGPAKAAPKA
jgi:hypothetical protein